MPFRLGTKQLMLAAIVGLATVPVSAEERPADMQARLDWAKRQVETVCEVQERLGQSVEASNCYAEVGRVIADAKRPIPGSKTDVSTRSKDLLPPPRPTLRSGPSRVAAAAPRTPAKPAEIKRILASNTVYDVAPRRRCANLLCPQFVLLGVGY